MSKTSTVICIVVVLVFSFILIILMTNQIRSRNESTDKRPMDKKRVLKTSRMFDNFTLNNSAQNGHFPSTYSFENDTIGSNPNDFIVSESPSQEVNIINGYVNHSKVVNISLISGTEPTCYNGIPFLVFGTIEVWLYIGKTTTNTEFMGIRLHGRVPTNYKMRCGVLNDAGTLKWSYFDSGWKYLSISNAQLDQWYNLKIEFECGSGQHYGLNADTFRLTVDNNESDVGGFEQGGQDINRVYLWLDTIYTNPMWVLYDGLGYSWDENYIISDNLINIGNQIYYQTNDIPIGTFNISISDNLNKYMRLYLMNNDDYVISFKFDTSYLYYTDYKTWIKYNVLLTNDKKEIEINFNCSTNTYDIYLENTLLDSGLDFYQNVFNINRVLFESMNKTYEYNISITDWYFVDIEITTPKAVNYNVGFDGCYYGSYTFTYEVGRKNNEIDLITFWSADVGTDAIVIENKTDKNGKDHKHVIEMFDNNSVDGEFRHGHICSAQTSGIMEFYLLVNSTNTTKMWFSFGFIQLFADSGISFNISGNRELLYQNETGWFFLQYIEFNKWYHLKWVFDCDDDWYLAYFDDTVYNLTYWKNPSGLNTWGVVSGFETVNSTMYIDAFGSTGLTSTNAFPYNESDNVETDLLLTFNHESFMNDSIWYTINDGDKVIIYGNHTLPFLSQGSYYIQVFCNDTNGVNYLSNVVHFTILIEIPTVLLPRKKKVDRDLWKPELPYFLLFFGTVYGVALLLIIIFALIGLIIYYKRYYE